MLGLCNTRNVSWLWELGIIGQHVCCTQYQGDWNTTHDTARKLPASPTHESYSCHAQVSKLFRLPTGYLYTSQLPNPRPSPHTQTFPFSMSPSVVTNPRAADTRRASCIFQVCRQVIPRALPIPVPWQRVLLVQSPLGSPFFFIVVDKLRLLDQRF
jgi:hypothetical protein